MTANRSIGGAGVAARALLSLALAANGCSREPSQGTPTDTGATRPGPASASASASAPAPAPVSASASASAAPSSPGEAVTDPDPLPDAERRGIAGWIAFVSERDGNAEVYLVRPSGDDLRRLTNSPAADFPVAPDPKSTALLLVASEDDHESKLHLEQLIVQPLSGGPGKPIGPRGGRNRNPSWSPDGRWVVFESDTESFSDIYRVGRDGSGLRRLTRNTEGNFEPALSPDGAQIAFVSSRDGDPELYRIRSDGTGSQRLTAFHREDWGPRWSPDGKRIAFLSDREGRTRIFLMNANGTQLAALTPSTLETAPPGPSPSENAGAQPVKPELVDELDPAWSPDGKRISFVTRALGKKARVWVASLAAGSNGGSTAECKPLTGGASGDDSPVWSPDGRHLVFVSNRAGNPELYLMRADGTGQTRLTRAPGADWLPRWIPPGRQTAGSASRL